MTAGQARLVHSLRWRLLAPMAATWAALAVVAIAGLNLEAERRLEQSLTRRAELLANLVNYNAESVSRIEDLQRLVSKAAAEPNVRLIVVTAGTPARVIAASRGLWAGHLVADLPPEAAEPDLREALLHGRSHHAFRVDQHRFEFVSALTLSLPAINDGSLSRGAVAVHLDTRAQQAELRRSMLRWLAVILLGASAVTLAGYRVLRRHVLTPLAAIGEAVRQRHEDDDRAWARTETGDELGALAHTLRESLQARARSESAMRLTERLASVGSLAGGVAHEINTPLQFVNDSVHFLRDASTDLLHATAAAALAADIPADAPAADAHAALARVRARLDDADLEYLAERMPLALTRSEEGVARVRGIVHSLQACADGSSHELQPEDLNRTVKNAVTVIERASAAVAAIETDFATLPPVVCHAGDVYDAVLQLLQNAVDAVAQRYGRAAPGVPPAGTLTVRTRQDDTRVVIDVTDNGVGIPDDIAHRVFDPFFTTKALGHGTGQGLAVAWRVVTETHGGDITFQSQPGQGTTFTIRLPIDGPQFRRDAA